MGCIRLPRAGKRSLAKGKLAVLFNTGTLVFPSRAPIPVRRPLQASECFSHADQVTQWQTSVPDQPPLTGWGGRCADLLAAVQPGAPISLSVTLSGANTSRWAIGYPNIPFRPVRHSLSV